MARGGVNIFLAVIFSQIKVSVALYAIGILTSKRYRYIVSILG